MKYVRYGSAGLEVSKLCLGTMTYGDPKWREWVLDEQAERPFSKAALDKGINYFDTADIYSVGRSEAVGVVAERLGASRASIALAWVLTKPGVVSPIIGASKPHHLDDAIKALDIKLGAETMKYLEEPYRPHSILGHA